MPFSALNYLTPAELPLFIRTLSSVTDEELAAGFISDAERVIDAYVGKWPGFYCPRTAFLGAPLASGAVSGSFADAQPYPARGGLYLTLLSGTPERRLIVSH